MRRALATLFVVSVAALTAWAVPSGGGSVTAKPSIAVVALTSGASAGSAVISLSTSSTTPLQVSGIVQDTAACDNTSIQLQNAGGFTLSSGTPKMEVAICPATAVVGMQRCLFHVRDTMNMDLGSFMVVCQRYALSALTSDTPSLAFTNVAVGMKSAPQTVTIHNGAGPITGTLQFQIDDDLDNEYLVETPCTNDNNGCDVTSVSLGSGSSIPVNIACQPATTSPPITNLHVSIGGYELGTPVQLSCAGSAATGPAISVTPSPLPLGAIEVTGGNQGSGTLHVTNIGNAPLTLSAISVTQVGADWSYALQAPCTMLPCNIGSNSSTDIAVTFDPSDIGNRDATLQIMSNAVNAPTSVQLQGSGLGATLEDLVDSSTIDFGAVPKNGTSAPFTIHLVNRGNRDLTDAKWTLSPATGFSITPANPITVPYQTGTTLELTCSPNGSTSTLMTTVTISAPDTVNTTPVTLNATCTGTDAALVAHPSSIAFGEVRTGTPMPAKPIALENVGTVALSLNGPPTMQPDVAALTLAGAPTMPIAAGGSAQMTLSAATTADTDLATTISATDDVDSGYTLQIPVTGKVVTASVSAPAAVALGTFCVDQPTSPATLSLMSTGTATIGMSTAPVLQGGAASPFQVTPKSPSSYPALLAAGETATVDLQPLRRSSPGDVSDKLVWTTDVASDPNPKTAVSATFLNSGAAIAPATVDFGQVPVHLPPNDSRPVTIQNCSDSAISLVASIDSPFAYDVSEFPSSLMPAQTATFGVSFKPTQIQKYDGYLKITSPTPGASSLMVHLLGEGVAGDGSGDGGPGGGNGLPDTSFYACSCTSTSPGGGLPIVLALGLVILRRRRGSSSPR